MPLCQDGRFAVHQISDDLRMPLHRLRGELEWLRLVTLAGKLNKGPAEGKSMEEAPEARTGFEK